MFQVRMRIQAPQAFTSSVLACVTFFNTQSLFSCVLGSTAERDAGGCRLGSHVEPQSPGDDLRDTADTQCTVSASLRMLPVPSIDTAISTMAGMTRDAAQLFSLASRGFALALRQRHAGTPAPHELCAVRCVGSCNTPVRARAEELPSLERCYACLQQRWCALAQAPAQGWPEDA